jgi:formylglycine-generating enzyme
MSDVAVKTPAHQSEGPAHPNVIWIPGGTFRMGSDKHYPEEAPVHRATVSGFAAAAPGSGGKPF